MPVLSDQRPSMIHFTGGLGLTPPTVGIYLASFGIAGIILQLLIYPRIQGRIGTLNVFRFTNAVFPLTYICAPYLALLAGHQYVKCVAMAAVLCTQVMARTMAIPSSVILLTDAVPHRSALGTVHGAGNTLSALASACGPAIGGLLLAWWTWMCVVSVIALTWSFRLSSTEASATQSSPGE